MTEIRNGVLQLRRCGPDGSLCDSLRSAPIPPRSADVATKIISSDIPTILALIKELAAYEKASSSVLASEESLQKTLFGPRPYGYTLLIFPPHSGSEEPQCAGLALYFYNYSTWRAAPGIYLEDLFIRPTFRGKGYGKRLFGELARELKSVGGERLEWSVLKWNQPSIDFYEGFAGAKKMEEWMTMRVDDEENGVEKLASWGKGVQGTREEVAK